MGLNRLHIATKLWIFIVLVIAAIASVAGIGLMRSATILYDGRTEQLNAVDLVKVTTQWNGLTQTNAARTLAMVLSAEPAVTAAFKDAVTATSAQITELQKRLDALPLTPADKSQLQKIADLRKSMLELRDKVRQLKTDSKAEEAVQMLNGQYIPSVASYIAAQQELVKMQEQRVLASQAETESRRVANTIGIMAGLAVIVTFVFLATAWLVRSIRLPLLQANELAARIAQGDLSADISTTREDEFGDLLRSLKTMNESLGRMVHQVRQSTDSIATASAEIATGNNDLAQRTEQTSSNLQSTASSMEQLTTTVQHSAENARQASTLAASASSVAEQGGAVVQQVVFTMEEINASSKKISDIIGVIDGIAFQTNILALNAAVEAARAGEQGRGFAVVASEVRSLAQRSAEAAKEIKMLIGTSVDKVASGTKLVSDAGSTMNDIVQSVRRVADVIGEITSAASEQSNGIAHVNQAIANLDQMTQQNAALVEQSAAAAESLRDQANQMAHAVAVFKVRPGAQSVLNRPARDITPRATPLTYARPQAKPRTAAALPPARPAARKPVAPAPAKPKSAPAASPSADSDWETF
jgi:methyl-accepting chemotaxis protein